MFRKSISLTLVCMLCLTSVVPVSAYNITDAHNALSNGVSGILTDDNGNEYIVEGVLVSIETTPAIMRSGVTSSNVSVTYAYSVPVQPRTGHSVTISDHDTAIASTVYLTIHYTRESNYPNADELYMTGVSGYWELLNSLTSVTDAQVSYASVEQGTLSAGQAVAGVHVQNNFHINIAFPYSITDAFGSEMSASLTVYYLMGTSRRWSFTLNNYARNPMDM